MEQQTSDYSDSFQFPPPGNHHLHNNSSIQYHNHQEQPQMFVQEKEESSSQMLPSNAFFRPRYHHHSSTQFNGGSTTTRTSDINGFHGQTHASTPIPWNSMPLSSYSLGQNNSGDLSLIAAQLEHKPQQQPTTMGDDHHRLLQEKTETPLIMIRTPGLPNDIDEPSAQNGGVIANGGGLTENGRVIANGGELTENGGGILTENGGGILTEKELIKHSPPPRHGCKRKMEDETATLFMETKLLDAVNNYKSSECKCRWLESQFRELAKRVNFIISCITQRDAIIVSQMERITGQKFHLPPLNFNFMNNNNGSTTTPSPSAATSTNAQLYHHHQQQAATSTNAQLYHHHQQQYILPSYQVQHPPQTYTHQPYQRSVITAPFVNVMSPSQSPARSNAEPGYTNSGMIIINTNNDMNDQNSTRWAEEEVHTLIKIRSSMEPNFNEPTGSKTALWKEISEKMKSIGYVDKTDKRCKEKWENCLKYYRKHKEDDKAAAAASGDNGSRTSSTESARKRTRHSRTESYFKLLDEYYAK